MQVLCPDCRHPLAVNGDIAHCHTHNKSFRVLFSRCESTATSAPAQDAYAAPSPDTAYTQSQAPLPEFVATSPPPPPIPAQSVACMLHPQNAATAYCAHCRGPICPTCDFAFPGGLHYCSTCMMNPQTSISPSRMASAYWSIALAVVATVAVGVLITIVVGAAAGDYDEGAQALDVIFTFVSRAASGTGLMLGFATMEKRSRTPPLAWAGIIWNGIIVILVALGMLSSLFA